MPSTIKIWACAARCKDGRDRTILGVYKGDQLVLMHRPWIAATTPLLIEPKLHKFLPMLSSLISVCDYNLYEGVWYGEVAVDWHVIASLTGLSIGTIETHLKGLSRAGLILYRPGVAGFRPPLIRVYPYQRTTGIHLIEPEASWLRSFVTAISPKTLEAEIDASGARGRTHLVRRPGARVEQNRACALVSEAPIFKFTDVPNAPKVWGHGNSFSDLPGNLMIIRTICKVPELESIAAMNCGVDPAVGYQRSEPVDPEDSSKEKPEAVNWRDTWTESGISVVPSQGMPDPEPGQLGVVPSWELVDDSVSSPKATKLVAAESDASPMTTKFVANEDDVAGTAEKSPMTTKFVARVPTVNDTNPFNLDNDFSDSIHSSDSYHRNDVSTLATNFVAKGDGAGAPVAGRSAPAPGSAPSAVTGYLRAPSKRQLTLEQLNGLYRQRGPRLTSDQREDLTIIKVSCIETYERVTGVPFCRDDMRFLDSAVTLTSHTLILRGISYASRFPRSNPGHFVMEKGFSHILNTIESNKFLHVRGKKSGKRVKVGSGISDVKEKPIVLNKADQSRVRAVPSSGASAPEPKSKSSGSTSTSTAGKVFVPPVQDPAPKAQSPAPKAPEGKVFVPPVKGAKA